MREYIYEYVYQPYPYLDFLPNCLLALVMAFKWRIEMPFPYAIISMMKYYFNSLIIYPALHS